MDDIIIYTTCFDPSSDEIIDWLVYANQSYKRINARELFDEINSSEKNISLDSQSKYKKVKAIWYRKLLRIDIGVVIKPEDDIFNKYLSKKSIFTLNSYINEELNSISNFSYQKYISSRILGIKSTEMFSKLHVLRVANMCGLNIPDTIITRNKKTLLTFFSKHKKQGIINKSISEHIRLTEDNGKSTYSNYTEEITHGMVENFPEIFERSLFQEKLGKKYELRIFYLNGISYSMAIFSQKNSKTEVDFRRYDKKKPNRTVLYQLPKKIDTQILKLMDTLGMNTGSIDMIKTKDDKFYFLEVNPSGQFGMVSKPCKYLLEKKIAQYLSE